MLPILVLLVAASAFAAPGPVVLNQISQNAPGDSSLLGRAYDIIDSGDKNIYLMNIGLSLKDLSTTPGGQSRAYGQAVTLLGEISTGRPGDACAAANFINEYASYAAGANNAGRVRSALQNYIQSVASNIDSLARAATNPNAARFATGSRGGCAGEGRTYQFEQAWDSIIGSATPNQISVINEEYCVAKRMYCALNARTNTAAAQLTASSLPPVGQVFDLARDAIANLLNAVASRSNVGAAASAAKQAITNAVGRVSL